MDRGLCYTCKLTANKCTQKLKRGTQNSNWESWDDKKINKWKIKMLFRAQLLYLSNYGSL